MPHLTPEWHKMDVHEAVQQSLRTARANANNNNDNGIFSLRTKNTKFCTFNTDTTTTTVITGRVGWCNIERYFKCLGTTRGNIF